MKTKRRPKGRRPHWRCAGCGWRSHRVSAGFDSEGQIACPDCSNELLKIGSPEYERRWPL
jgi:DNA-directed RNA polymerase subunit RPC12/RpoP